MVIIRLLAHHQAVRAKLQILESLVRVIKDQILEIATVETTKLPKTIKIIHIDRQLGHRPKGVVVQAPHQLYQEPNQVDQELD